MERAEAAMRANFELLVRARVAPPATANADAAASPPQDKLGVDYYCFHDRDIAPEVRGKRRGARYARDTRASGAATTCRALQLGD